MPRAQLASQCNRSKRFPSCVLLAFSWNTNANPSTDKLSRQSTATGHKISKTFAWNDSTQNISTGILIVDLYRFMKIKPKKKEALSIYSTLETSGKNTGKICYEKITQ